MEVFLHPSILQTDCSKIYYKDNFGSGSRSNNFGSTGSATLVESKGLYYDLLQYRLIGTGYHA